MAIGRGLREDEEANKEQSLTGVKGSQVRAAFRRSYKKQVDWFSHDGVNI